MNKTTLKLFLTNKKKSVKPLCLLMLNLFFFQMSFAQITLPHYDGLNYTVGESLALQSSWVINQPATPNDMLITSGSLSYTGLPASTGNKVAFATGGEDAIKIFTTTATGKFYHSYIMNISSLGALVGTGGYFEGLLANTVANSTAAPGSGAIGAPVYVRPSANSGFFNIGFTARANQTTIGALATNLQYGTTDYAIGTPVFIVVSYEIVSGSNNDICKLWINPTPGQIEPAFTFTATPTTDIADITGFYIRQNGTTSTPNVEMDEMRFGLTWADVTPAAAVNVTPTLLADVTANTVDNTIDITFVDSPTWRSAVTAVKIGTTTLTAGTDYDLTAGNLKLKPSGLNVLLTTSGSKAVTVSATAFTDALVTQIISAGVPTTNSTATIDAPLFPNGSSIITVTAKDQYNNLVPNYTFKYDATLISATSITLESYTIDGAAQTASATDVSLTSVTNSNGIATFSVTLPSTIDGSDGITVQTQLADGTTNIGAAFSFIQIASQSITFNALASVTFGAADFNLNATASSGLAVSYTSSNPLVASVTSAGVVTIVGVGTTIITASQSGNSNFSAAPNVTQNLVVNCAPASAIISGTTGICSGNTANLQVAISSSLPQQYTLVYTDGTSNFTVSNYISGTSITITPTGNTTYTLVSVLGSNPNSCTATVSGNAIITLNPNVTPTFTQVAPICNGGTLSALPTTSTNSITGTWQPALNTTTTTTYTFTPTAGQCATTTTMLITVNPNVTPTFTQVAPICNGGTLSALPTTSTNSITGTWQPALNTTTTTTYTFTPTAGQCATTTTMLITVNPNVTPTFAQVAPICNGGTLSALPTTSTNSITGTWQPALNNTTTTTYTFTPTAGQCATTTTMLITVNPNVTPTFTQVAPICNGETLSALPTTSTNSITGTWQPALNNATTTTYTFTPTAGQCATTTTMLITVNTTAAPTGNSTQVFNTNNPVLISDLVVTGTLVIWYASSADATNNVNPLANNFAVTSGTTYYAMQTVNGCRSSSPLAVTVTVNLSNSSFGLNALQYYPNPVRDFLNISYPEMISKIEVLNMLGQIVLTENPNIINPSINLSQLPASNYFVLIESNGKIKVLKIVKLK